MKLLSLECHISGIAEILKVKEKEDALKNIIKGK